MPEFDLIRRLQKIIDPPSAHGGGCVLGIGDDAAVLEAPPGKQLVVCTDALVEGVHFPPGTPARALGHKSLAVNLSDLAAMGAEPAWFLLALTLPRAEPAWLDAFAEGMAALAGQCGIRLVGGDTTSGPLNICVTAAGCVEPGKALTRSGAQPGDLVVVSGVPGRAALALEQLKSGVDVHAEARRALDYPEPRLELGLVLSGLASACIDISDGLLADLGHILEQSGVGAEIDLDKLPEDPALAEIPSRQRWPLQLAGGDDYELCFTVPSDHAGRLEQAALSGAVTLSVIGRVREERGLSVREPNGQLYVLPVQGYEHFSAPAGAAGKGA